MQCSRRAVLAGLPGLLAAQKSSAISGTWVLQQVSSLQELGQAQPALAAALGTSGVRGLCLRAAWKAIDRDFALLDSGFALARRHSLSFAVGFMAGRHTPARVFEGGSPFYTRNGERVPLPFLPDGSPNTVFETEYRKFVQRLAEWCRARSSPLLHMAWYGQDGAELHHGQEARAAKGYRYENWLRAHLRLIDIALEIGDQRLATELPFSGHGPLTDAALRFTEYVIGEIGGWNPVFFCQANGWGPRGEWGAPDADTEAAFDKVWAKPICRGLQTMQPHDYEWPAVFQRLYDTRATYGEVHAASFRMEHGRQLAEEIRKFMTYCQKQESGT